MSTPPFLSLKREDLKDAKGEWVEKLTRALTSFGRQTQDAFDRNISVVANLNATLKTMDITTQDDWIAPTLINSWVNFGGTTPPAGYRKVNGHIEMRGAIKNGTIPAAAFVLPVGFRPRHYIWVAEASNSAFGFMTVSGNGSVNISAGNNAWFTLTSYLEAADTSPVPNPIFPVTFKHGLKGTARPMLVLATNIQDLTSKTAGPHVSSPVSWQVSGDSIRIEDLPILNANRHYRVTFLVLGE